MSTTDRKSIQDEIQAFRTGTRTQSVALLAWFLQAVWRIEPEDVGDAICDGSGDKGIDGILVDDDLGEITVLQSKYRTSATKTQGDLDLKNLIGAAAYFASESTVDGLLASHPNRELTRLLNRLEIKAKVAAGAHATRLIFITNGLLDAAGQSYVEALGEHDPPLEVWDQSRLAAVARRVHRPDLLPDRVELNAVAPPTVIAQGGKTQLAVGIIPAKQLVALPGLSDLSLFARNVRLSEGRTRVT